MIQMNCQGLSLGYDVPLVRDLRFTVSAGDYLYILGENGAGKSTLMKTILGLLPPLDGRVTLGGGVRANEIGYLPQQTQTQRDFPATVWEVVLSGCQSRCGLRPFYTRAEKDLARQSLRRMDMERLSRRCYRELSGGQQQRVLLARALCAARKMLLLDEPVAGLDPAASREMYQVIDRLNQQDGMTILMISHDAQAALRCASHILYLGRQVFFGTREAFVQSAPGRRYLSERGGEDHGPAD
ncbi:MAG: ABC transporter ATP-binding protein [Evtepia sp.]|uniref:metal ABC transporter ATP-binding protein n=1 Tax=Evtepia sp. TaxID=2773933 RepID=UPI002A75A53F|nr:ABC transporter ATP-binding protein [Evtepia sp.]MDY3014644.1 ABC transporter ATP-binding protein [Evtepia sp.]